MRVPSPAADWHLRLQRQRCCWELARAHCHGERQPSLVTQQMAEMSIGGWRPRMVSCLRPCVASWGCNERVPAMMHQRQLSCAGAPGRKAALQAAAICAAMLLHGRPTPPRQQGHPSRGRSELPRKPKGSKEPAALALQALHVRAVSFPCVFRSACTARAAYRRACCIGKHDGHVHLPLCCRQCCLSRETAGVVYAITLGARVRICHARVPWSPLHTKTVL